MVLVAPVSIGYCSEQSPEQRYAGAAGEKHIEPQDTEPVNVIKLESMMHDISPVLETRFADDFFYL